MKKFLVIGNPISHSLSPLIHNYWMKKHKLINHVYEKKKIEKSELKSIVNQVRKNEISGVNVTVPFKKEIIPLLDHLDDTAKSTQSVNTLSKVKNEVWGYNTDSPGFKNSLTCDIVNEYADKDIYILGAGGVTSSIIYSFIFTANKIYITNRTREKAEKLRKLDLTGKIEVLDWGQKPTACDLVINTTSVGLKKNENLGLDFIDYKNKKNVLFYDIIYNPKETNFLKNARLRGNRTMNGQMMFLKQAQIAFQIWTGIYPEINNEVIKLLD